MTVRFKVTTQVPATPGEAFDLSLDVDAHAASMAASGERAIPGVTSGRLRLDEEVTWRAKHLGIVFTMSNRITALDRPHRFVDEQVRGPFRRFHHEHRFAPRADGGTTMVDTVTFDAPCGPVGVLAERLLLGRYLRRLIEERNAYLRAVLTAAPPPRPQMS